MHLLSLKPFALYGIHPRVIADETWAKLLWAGLNLAKEDLPTANGSCYYPLEFMRALALVWLFGGLRSDEIVRLRIGCIRWQTTTEMKEEQTICYLDVPPNKTGTAFTKPVDPIVGQAIAAWETIRPKQPTAMDRRTGSASIIYFLIGHEPSPGNTSMKVSFLLYVAKPGISTSDVRGRITSHRARATIATQLYNAKEPERLSPSCRPG